MASVDSSFHNARHCTLLQIARFDFTWGSAEYHQETLNVLKAAMKQTELICAVCMEPAGREMIVLNR